MEARELYVALDQVIRGDLSAYEFRHLAQLEGFSSFSELCEDALPADLADIRIRAGDVVRRLDSYSTGGIELKELWAWAEELHHISFNHRLAFEPETEEIVIDALSALRVICNEEIFPQRGQTLRDLRYLWGCLKEGQPLFLRDIFARLFEGLEECHLATLGAAPGEDDDNAQQWADVVILSQPFDPGKNLLTDYSWVMAFTVTTRTLFEAELESEAATAADEPEECDHPDCPGCGPWEQDRVEQLRLLVPNFVVDRYQPSYFVDAEGVAEVVLQAERISEVEVRYAAKLFCLANYIGSCYLDGERLRTLRIRPVGVG